MADVYPVGVRADETGLKEPTASDTARFAGKLKSDGVHIAPSAPPASASATGEAGTITWASGWLYVCVATDTWQRVAIATW